MPRQPPEETSLVLEESVDEEGRRERRVANLDSAEDVRAVHEYSEAEQLEREMWGGGHNRPGASKKERTDEASRARGLGGGAEWPRMPGMKPIRAERDADEGLRRSPRKLQKAVETADLFGAALKGAGSSGVLQPKKRPAPQSQPAGAKRQAAAAATARRLDREQPQQRRSLPQHSRAGSAGSSCSSSSASAAPAKPTPKPKKEVPPLDDVDQRKLKRVMKEQLSRNDLRTLTPRRLRRKCEASMAYESGELEKHITLVNDFLRQELLSDPASYLERSGFSVTYV